MPGLPSPGDAVTAAVRVLLVPPLAAPAVCFDLRRGCSVAGHLLRGHETYLVAGSSRCSRSARITTRVLLDRFLRLP
jgi:hypothetical protein